MSNIVQKIIQHARLLVHESKHTELAESDALKRFLKIFSRLTLEDLDLKPAELQYVPKIPRRFQAPVSFVNIFVDDNLSLQLFGLRDRFSRIPPHDHPSMHGFIKCVHGSIKIKSFNLLPQYNQDNVPDIIRDKVKPSQLRSLVGAIFVGEEVVSSKDPRICSLTPTIGNIHEILSASDEIAVIVDVIMPPYKNDAGCNFFEPVAAVFDENLQDNVTWMIKSFDPKEFRCQDIPYNGPPPVVSPLDDRDG